MLRSHGGAAKQRRIMGYWNEIGLALDLSSSTCVCDPGQVI